MGNITVLALLDRVSCYHSLTPFLFSPHSKEFTFTSSVDYCLYKDKNPILLMVRQFIKPDVVNLELLKTLRQKYQRIVYFHDDAGGGIPRLQVLPFVDLFYSKALFKDRSLYGRPLYGKELYSDYFHSTYGIQDPKPQERAIETDPAQLAKLRLSWNIGIGDYPRGKFRQRVGVAFSRFFDPPLARWFYHPLSHPYWVKPPDFQTPRPIDVHARLTPNGTPSIAYQRELLSKIIASDSRFLTGPTSQAQYNRELLQSKAVLSPFGWGELCLRDFEAIRSGAVLVKPKMDHLETWPNIFYPNHTYVPIQWDGSDLLSVVDEVLQDSQTQKRLAVEGYKVYAEQLAQMPERFERILEEIMQLY
jgi:hypothetical protein